MPPKRVSIQDAILNEDLDDRWKAGKTCFHQGHSYHALLLLFPETTNNSKPETRKTNSCNPEQDIVDKLRVELCGILECRSNNKSSG